MYIFPPQSTPSLVAVVKVGTTKLTMEVASDLVPVSPNTVSLPVSPLPLF